MDLKVRIYYLKLEYQATKNYTTLQQFVRLLIPERKELNQCQP